MQIYVRIFIFKYMKKNLSASFWIVTVVYLHIYFDYKIMLVLHRSWCNEILDK